MKVKAEFGVGKARVAFGGDEYGRDTGCSLSVCSYDLGWNSFFLREKEVIEKTMGRTIRQEWRCLLVFCMHVWNGEWMLPGGCRKWSWRC